MALTFFNNTLKTKNEKIIPLINIISKMLKTLIKFCNA